MVHRALTEFYTKDPSAKSADLDIIAGILMPTIQNPKHKERFKNYLTDIAGADASVPNVSEFVLAAKRAELAGKVAVSMANRDGNEDKLIKEYMEIQQATSLDTMLNDDVVIIDSSNIHQLMDEYLANEGGFQLYPKILNDRLKGRLSGGHHVIVFAVPEMGKTAFAVTAAAGFCIQGKRGLYIGNEDKNEDIYFRIAACLSGMTYDEVLKDRTKAIDIAMERGLGGLTFLGMAPGNVAMVERYAAKFDPEYIITDQMINFNEKGDGLNQILGKASKGLRTLCKAREILGVSLCQGADSAAGKSILEQGDVYMSNCLAKGELVRMFDGSVKAVEDIQVGEQVMGMDDLPRSVLATGKGSAPLYRITHKNRDSYIVNEDHIMVVKNSDTINRAGIKPKQVADIELKILLDRKNLLTKLKGVYKGRITYPAKELPLDPYLFGLWLADGFSHTFSISTSDTQLKEHLNEMYSNVSNRVVNGNSWVVGFDQGGWQNPNNIKLKELGVYRNKHVPQAYLTCSVEQRLKLLSGIIDGDGYLFKPGEGKGDNYRIALGHNETLALDVKELAAGLGFASTIRHQVSNGYMVYVAGPVTALTCVLSRKIARENSKIDYLASSLSIEKVSDSGEFYGISVDGDKRYVLANNIITHNTEVPANCDLLIGIGANRDQIDRNERTLSLCKNKVSGDHTPINVKIIPQLSRYTGLS